MEDTTATQDSIGARPSGVSPLTLSDGRRVTLRPAIGRDLVKAAWSQTEKARSR